MATKIRFKRIGRRNRPFYRMVVMDSRNRRDGAAIEELGWYNPIDENNSYNLKEDRIIHWLKDGAQVTNAAHKLFKKSGLAHRWHLINQGIDQKQIDKEMEKWSLNRADVEKKRLNKKEVLAAKKEVKEEVKADEPMVEAPTLEEKPEA